MERNLLNERFITIEKLADGELSHKLPGLTVKFSFAETFLGEVLVASTPQGVCYMAFVVRGRDMAESEMMNRFPGVFFEIGTDEPLFRQRSVLRSSKAMWLISFTCTEI